MIAIFDWDGTLCDSVDQIVAAMLGAAAEAGLPAPTVPAVRDIIGLGLPQAVARLFPGLDEEGGLRLAETYSRHYLSGSPDVPALFDGALDTLLALRERGVELAVATGKSRRGLDRMLNELAMADLFHITRCADETRSKPHPLMVQQILAERGKQPHEALMIGDSEHDLAMAQQAGVGSVAVSFGVHDEARLAPFSPLMIIDSLPQLLEVEAFCDLSESGPAKAGGTSTPDSLSN